MPFLPFLQVGLGLGLGLGLVRELLAYVAKARGKLKRGGIPDLRAAACIVINDFNSGMIPFYIKPPRRLLEQTFF